MSEVEATRHEFTARDGVRLSGKAKPSDVPHDAQNGRAAIGDERYQSGSLSQVTSAFGTEVKAIEMLPLARWHMRQWQR